MYSQNNEEEIILNYFGSTRGRLLEIGAFDGIQFSNTRKLLEQDWTGVLVEASPRVFSTLMANAGDLDVELINAAIVADDQDGLIPFYDNQGAVATTSPAHADKWKSHAQFEYIHVMSCGITRLLKRFGTDYDFINIDVEGESASLFLTMYHLCPNVKMWCVEHDDRIDEILSHAVNHREIARNAENLILAI